MISLLATTISLLATTIIATGRASAVESVGVLNPWQRQRGTTLWLCTSNLDGMCQVHLQ